MKCVAPRVAAERLTSASGLPMGLPTSQPFATVNPTGKVPALALHDGTVMFESAAMLVHLTLEHPTADLAPQPGTGQHARFLQWMVFLPANVYESALRTYYPVRYSSRAENDAEPIRKQGTRDFLAHLTLINEPLDPYVLGNQYSVADLYLYMLASWFPGGKSDLHARLPAPGTPAQKLSLRPAVSTVMVRRL
jgi:glutathione S-transferase